MDCLSTADLWLAGQLQKCSLNLTNHFASETPQFADQDNEGERRGHVGNPMSGRKWSKYEEESVASKVRRWEQGEDGVGQPVWPDESKATSLIYTATLSNALYQDSLSFTPDKCTGGTVVKNLPASAGDTGSITRLGRSPGVGNGKPLQYSCLENFMDRETGRLQSMGQRIWHNWARTHTHTHTPMHTKCLQPMCKSLFMFHLTNMYQLSTLYVPGTEDSLVTKTSSLLPVQSKTTHSLVSDSQSGAPGATASALPKNLLEGQICQPQLKSIEWESLQRKMQSCMFWYQIWSTKIKKQGAEDMGTIFLSVCASF